MGYCSFRRLPTSALSRLPNKSAAVVEQGLFWHSDGKIFLRYRSLADFIQNPTLLCPCKTNYRRVAIHPTLGPQDGGGTIFQSDCPLGEHASVHDVIVCYGNGE